MNKWVLLTGASSGIGYNIAKYLDSQGYNLVIVARSREKLEELSNSLRNDNLVVAIDLCYLDEIENLFRICKEKDIKLDGLVHCAGIGINNPVKSNVVQDMDAIMRTNYFSFVELSKYFSLRKYSKEASSIVAISSISPLTCYPGACNYAASKGAINTAVKVMSKEFLKRRIRVNAILPGYVNTPLGPAEDDPVYIAQQPLGIIKAEYISYMVEYLLSEKSRFITGSLIPISGGMNF